MLKKTTLTIAALALVVGGGVFAATDTDLTQDINPGTLLGTILDQNGDDVADPSVAMTATTFSFECQDAGDRTTGTLGTNTERLYLINPDAADNGFNLNIAATGGATDNWTDGSNDYDFNDPTTAGCTDGADTDSLSGQLTLDNTNASFTDDYSGSDNTGISIGAGGSFDEGTTDSLTLLTGAANSSDVWRGYVEDFDVLQSIPAETPVGSYDINLTLTAVAQ